MTDQTLLDQFVKSRSQDAFAALVDRHIGMVYNGALRQVRNTSLAEDVCQAVFIILAKKASSLSSNVILPGWLIRTTHLASHDALRAESRRRNHEQQYAAMKTEQTFSPDAFSDELSPEIDRALSHLNDADRSAIVLRYLQNEPLAQVAATLKVSEETATKRVQRALGKLRNYFSRHPITPSAAALEAAMRNLPHLLPPSSLVRSVSCASIAGNASAQSSSIARGALRVIFWSKAKIALVILATVLLGGAAIETVSFVRAQASSAPTASPSPSPTASTSPSTVPTTTFASLSCGVWVEILGVGPVPSDGKGWWHADGSPLSQAPLKSYFKKPEPILKPKANQIARQIAIRIHWPQPQTGPGVNGAWFVRGATIATNDPDALNSDNHSVTYGQTHGLLSSPGEKIVFRADFATGPWQTYIQSGPAGQSVSRDGVTYSISKAEEINGTVHFRFDGPAPGVVKGAEQMIVLDTSGARHELQAAQTTGTSKITNSNYVAPIPLSNLKEIRFEVRPYDQWIEISNICDDPSRPTEVKIATSEDNHGGL
jgi:RNA polymerase sigma factor (sigma-70 family)